MSPYLDFCMGSFLPAKPFIFHVRPEFCVDGITIKERNAALMNRPAGRYSRHLENKVIIWCEHLGAIEPPGH